MQVTSPQFCASAVVCKFECFQDKAAWPKSSGLQTLQKWIGARLGKVFNSSLFSLTRKTDAATFVAAGDSIYEPFYRLLSRIETVIGSGNKCGTVVLSSASDTRKAREGNSITHSSMSGNMISTWHTSRGLMCFAVTWSYTTSSSELHKEGEKARRFNGSLILPSFSGGWFIMIVGHGANSMTMEEARAKLCAEAK